MTTTVKICGLRSETQVLEVAALAADQIGFMFAPSKRRVTAEDAGRWIEAMRLRPASSYPKAVGVFVNAGIEEMASVLAQASLDVVQLHGQEDGAHCAAVKQAFPHVQVYKAVTLPAERQGQAPQEAIGRQLEPYRGAVDAILLDTFDPVYGGGSGKTFDWEAIPPYLAWCREAGIPLLVAGGLQPDNVVSLVDAYAPDGVDVSSGVETDGVKDIVKIQRFIERVKRLV